MKEILFTDKVALVTGSSRGLGNAIARKLARAGSDIVINYRKAGGSSQAQGEQLCEEIRAMGRRALLIQADISKKESVKKLFQEITERFGQLDFLIFCIQEALPLLEKAQGSVVFISSLGSRFYNPAYPLGSMKAAMESIIRDCAESMSDRHISVNAVCGGLVKTDSFKVLRQYWEDIQSIPDELFVEPDEIAEVVLFLCDPASRGIRGQTIVVDRGLSNRLYRSIKHHEA